MENRLKRYGEMAGPERRMAIEGQEDALQFVDSSYAIFRGIAEKILADYLKLRPLKACFEEKEAEMLYSEACGLIEGKENLGWDGKEVVELVRGKATPFDGTGVYLSALLNRTSTDTLVIEYFRYIDYIGYRLGEGKKLALGTGVRAGEIGNFGQGCILHWGDSSSMAWNAEGGLQINFGSLNAMAGRAGGGVQVNLGHVSATLHQAGMGCDASGGIQVNLGSVHRMSPYASGGIQVNFGETRAWGEKTSTNIQVDGGMGRLPWFLSSDAVSPEERLGMDMMTRPLREKMEGLESMKHLELSNLQDLEEALSFDSAAFESDVMAIGHEIGKYARTKYG